MKTWPKVKLGDVCAINPKVQSPDVDSLISVVPMSAVSEAGEIDASAVQPFGDVSKGLTLFQEGDVLFAKITPCMENGKGAVAVGLQGGIGAGSTEFFVLRPDSKRVTSAWVYHFTKREAFRRLAAERMTGSGGQRRVPRVFLESVTLPLPPLAEQERIAAELNAVAATLKKRQAQLAELDALVEARFIELFGDPVLNSRGWKAQSLDESYEIIDGDRGKNYPKQEDFHSQGYCLFLNAKNVTSSGFSFNERSFITREKDEILRTGKLQRNDIVLTTRGTVGNIAYYDSAVPFEHIRINSGMVLLRNRSFLSILPCYFIEFFRRFKPYQRLITGSAQPQLPISLLKRIAVPAPPLELQERFAAEAARVEAIKAKVRDGIAETQTLFDALTQKYFG